MEEHKLLTYTVELTEKLGVRTKEHTFDVNADLVQKLIDWGQAPIALHTLQEIADKCYAREWIEYAYFGSGDKYAGFRLTSKGIGVARSKIAVEKEKQERTLAQKTSDFIVDHKGLFILLGAFLGIAGLVIRSVMMKWG